MRKISDKARALKTKADQAYAQQKWKKALALFIEVSQEMPGDARIRQRLGDLFKRENQTEEAITEYKAAVTIYANDGFWAKAIAINKMILAIDPNDLQVQKKLAEMYAKQDTQTVTLPEIQLPSPSPSEKDAISISKMDPKDLSFSPEDHGFLGAAVSIAGAEPRTMQDGPKVPALEEAEAEGVFDHHLGEPVKPSMSIPLLSEMSPDELNAVLERLSMREFAPGTIICEEGEMGDSMFIIADGTVEVFTVDGQNRPIPLCQLSGGEFFGEYGLLTKGPRNASVQTTTEVECLEITWKDFEFIASKYPRIWNILEHHLRDRILDGILQKSPVFQALAVEERKKLISLMELQQVSAGTVVMSEGSAGEEMYFVKTGTLSVTIAQEHEHLSVGQIGPGDYFGEVALLTGKPRTATVMTKGTCELYCLHRRDAAGVFKGNREILVRLKEKMVDRAQETADVFQSYREARTTLDLV